MLGFLKKNDGKAINVNDIDNLIGKVELIDIREEYEYKGGSIKGSKNIPMGELLGDPDKYLDKNKEYYIMCQSGGRSSKTCNVLSKQGYDVVNVSGGMGSYAGTKRE
ncbi:rhodanese-like domain-containing protein [Clostridium cellulovorans]|uniref:Rhodanese domain protein n=1 Tax=Clostridium cellulovorans (strain ATCC 35296 / DSM 3052 / OCM 3 / 743B) TaxID=573061 RepID=D9SPJ4_CLOC7|nr:rhodanese-like domain-containing protein [Clostridium cellulovorans]ADL50043.1 Rhodanese domain protein [Clostridium cellulovorans 743B]